MIENEKSQQKEKGLMGQFLQKMHETVDLMDSDPSSYIYDELKSLRIEVQSLKDELSQLKNQLISGQSKG